MKKFNNKVIKELKYYVYALTYKDEDEDIIFYIGKGKGNRVFEHFKQADKLKLDANSLKNLTNKIEFIKNKRTNAFIINAGLTEKDAFLIESTLISTMKMFKKQTLTNIVSGHHSFTPCNVNIIPQRYSTPINLEEFCLKNKVKILTLKSTEESYYSALDKDFRSVLEGMWKLNKDKMEEVDYVLGVLKGTIYAVYKYIKGSYKKINVSWTQDDLDHWNTTHISIGRPEHYYYENDNNVSELEKQGRGVMKLSPVSIPESQKVSIGFGISENEIKIGNQLINKTIADKKFEKLQRGSRFYFGFNN